jgi:hypothetical protein
MFKAYRPKGAFIGFAPDPRTAHECGDSRYLAIPFFDACLAMRLPEPGSAEEKLKPVDAKSAWLATLESDVAVPAAKYDGDPAQAGWLPNERIAKAWMEYVKTGAVDDVTPPPAPVDIELSTTADGKPRVTWDAAADFESGLQAFLVLRDGEQIGQAPEKPVGRFGRPLFQGMSYHDTPEQPLAVMEYVDAAAKPGEKHQYQIIAVNSVGLKSAPSAEAKKKP